MLHFTKRFLEDPAKCQAIIAVRPMNEQRPMFLTNFQSDTPDANKWGDPSKMRQQIRDAIDAIKQKGKSSC